MAASHRPGDRLARGPVRPGREPRRAAAGFVTGLLADLQIKTCLQLAEQAWHRFTTLALAALAVLAICAADARTADRHAEPDMIELTGNEIRRLNNILLIHPTRSVVHRLRWSTGDADTRHEPDEPTTPAASASNSNHDHEWRLSS